jgi:hypothetical protein
MTTSQLITVSDSVILQFGVVGLGWWAFGRMGL